MRLILYTYKTYYETYTIRRIHVYTILLYGKTYTIYSISLAV